MKKKTRVLSAILAACMLAAAATSCSSSGNESSSADPAPAAPDAPSAADNNEAAAQTPPESTGGPSSQYFNADGSMILPLVQEETRFRVLWNKQPNDKGTMADKVILNQAYEATGITWDVEEVSEQGWDEKVSVVFASNDLPDLFCGKIDNLINFTDQCLDVTDMLPEYAPYMADFYFNQYPAIFGAEAFEGRMYSMPQVRVNNICYGGGWEINTRWLKNVGMELPETIDDLYEVLKAFRDQDANGNGDPNDEIPYSFVKIDANNKVGERGVTQWMNAFGMINDGANKAEHYIMAEDGKIIFTPLDQRFYDMLVYLNKLYSENLIDKDSFVQEVTDQYAKATSDKIGFATCGGLITELWGETVSDDIEYILPPKSQYDRALKQSDPPAELNLHVYTITTACEQPELLLLFQEYCNTGFDNRVLSLFGPEGGAWLWNDEGKMVNNSDFTDKPYATVAQARATLAPNYRMASIMEEGDEGKREYVGFSLKYNQSHKDFYGVAGGAAYGECFPLGNDTAENTAERSEMFAEISTYLQNFIAESIMNGIDEAKWEAHKTNCQKLNVEGFVANYQALYDSLMSLRG